MKKFLVGGAVRDKLMSKTPKDFDYTVVLDPGSYADPFQWMVDELKDEGFKIFLESPEHFTVRAQFPEGDGGQNLDAAGGKFLPGKKRLTADFVLARKEGPYSDGRRPDYVLRGTLEDDLARRDFTMNAIAYDIETGGLIDPYNGRLDISNGVIRAVGDPKERMLEDSLRVLRALRFSVQLGFGFDPDLLDVLYDIEVNRALKNNVSAERKMDEINKMFKIDTIKTLRLLDRFWLARNAVFNDGQINLMATMKTKGFNNSPKPKKGGSNLPSAYNGCECICHTEKGVMHMSACCHPSKNS